MIFVRFLSEASGNLVGFVMEGHAGYADPGEDIVCAAGSSVAYMTANTILLQVSPGAALRCRYLLTGL